MSKTNDKHQKTKNKTYCQYCRKYIKGSSYKFKAHLYLHNAVKPRYQCNYCLKGYYRYDMFYRHLTSHENFKAYKNIFICDYCDRSYIDKRNLIVHLRIHDDSIAPNLLRFECKACGADFCENRILLNHIRRVHFNQIDADEPFHVKRMVNETWFENVVQTDTCVEITKINNNVISIKKCGKIKIENATADIKNKNIVKENNILRTDNYTSYSKAICDYCKKEMLKKSIRNHIRERHLNIRKFKCTECKRSFNRHYQLSDHICGVDRRKQRRDKNNLKSNLKREKK